MNQSMRGRADAYVAKIFKVAPTAQQLPAQTEDPAKIGAALQAVAAARARVLTMFGKR